MAAETKRCSPRMRFSGYRSLRRARLPTTPPWRSLYSCIRRRFSTLCLRPVCRLGGALQVGLERDLQRHCVALRLTGKRNLINHEEQGILLHCVDEPGDLSVITRDRGLNLDSLHIRKGGLFRLFDGVFDLSLRADPSLLEQLFHALRDLRVATGEVCIEDFHIASRCVWCA